MFWLLVLLFASFTSAGFSEAYNWLASNQQADGSFGSWAPYTSLALMGLQNSSSAVSWLVSDLQNNASFSWGEADAPGAALFALKEANYSGNITAFANHLKQMQGLSGGFIGWWAANGTVEDAADTAWAVLGLAVWNESVGNASAYLKALQNADGSVNLTSVLAESSLSALAPSKEATTALALLVWKQLNESGNFSQNALGYLRQRAPYCFGGGSYRLSLSSWAFAELNQTEDAAAAKEALLAVQNQSGGFADSLRSSSAPNAIDSGLAAFALRRVQQNSVFSCTPAFSASIFTTSPITNASVQNFTLSLNGNLSNGTSFTATLNVTNPSGVNASLTFNNLQATYPNTTEFGTYSALASVNISKGNQSNVSTTFTSFVVAPPVRVGVVTSFPNSTTLLHCVSVANGSSAETALRATGLSTGWASFSFGNALTKINDVGCSPAQPWCQCTDFNACCLSWGFRALNKTTETWFSPSVGFSSFNVTQEEVIGAIWTGNFNKNPPLLNFTQVCSTNATALAYETDAPACNSCSSNAQCASGFCVHGTCRPAAAYCGDGFCDADESCSQDCSTATPPPSGSTSSTLTVKIDFPGANDVFQTVSTTCGKALDCFKQAASIECQYYEAAGALACPGVTKTCLVTKINGFAPAAPAYWFFYVNNVHASIGVSCYDVKPGDVIEFRTEQDALAPTTTGASSSALPSVQQPATVASSQATAAQQKVAQSEKTGFTISYKSPIRFEGGLVWHLPFAYEDYVSGILSFKPKPTRVKQGSILAEWQVSLDKDEVFAVNVSYAKPVNESVLQNIGQPVAKKTKNRELKPTAAATIQPPPVAQQTGLVTANQPSLEAIAAVMFLAIIAFLLSKK